MQPLLATEYKPQPMRNDMKMMTPWAFSGPLAGGVDNGESVLWPNSPKALEIYRRGSRGTEHAGDPR